MVALVLGPSEKQFATVANSAFIRVRCAALENT